MLDWLIVGGGVHGTHLSRVLTGKAGVAHDRLVVLDPHEAPLAAWHSRARSVGMGYLRSPSVHHLDLAPMSLAQFAKRARRRDERPWGFSWPYDRPATALFEEHTRVTVHRHRLDVLRSVGVARGLVRHGEGFRVETDRGAVEARRVVLALGGHDRPHWPTWALDARRKGGRVEHVFAEDFDRDRIEGDVAVIGGGISAVQVALSLAARTRVVLLRRHEVRISQFDSDAGWLGPRFLEGFAREVDLARRRSMILRARQRGSIPPDLDSRLRAAVARGVLEVHEREVDRVDLRTGASGPRLAVHAADVSRTVDRIVFATGFEPGRPGGALVDHAVVSLGLPCAACGFPVVDQTLQWCRGLYVSGPLAELELGPTARNIAGARAAGARISAAA